MNDPSKGTPGQPLKIFFESLQSRPDLREASFYLDEISFPAFLADSRTSTAFDYIADNYPQTVLLLCENDTVLATCFACPICLPDNQLPDHGWEGAIGIALAGGTPSALFAFSISVAASARGMGLGGQIVECLKIKAKELGVSRVITPVRPTGINKYPRLTVEEYSHLVDDRTSESVDAWIRTLQRHGGRVAGIGTDSHVIKMDDGDWPSVVQWEEWTSMKFPQDGEYEIPGGCAKLKIHDGVGEYHEDCIWVTIDTSR